MFLLVLLSGVLAQFSEVSFKTTIIDSPVDQVFWCGGSVVFADDDYVQQDEETEKGLHRKIPFVLSNKGILYRSLDYGFKWANVTQNLINQFELHEDYHFKDVFQSPADSNTLYFIASGMSKSYKTENCGSKFSEFNHPVKMYGFKFNKMNRLHIMGFTEKACQKGVKDCRDQYKRQLHISEDGGKTWRIVLENVKDASWDKLLHYELIPDTRIIAAHLVDGQQLVTYSDNFFSRYQTISKEAFGFHQTHRYLFLLVRPDEYSQGYDLEILPAFVDSSRPKEVVLPLQDQNKHTFTVLEASDDQVFLSVSHHEDLPKLTNIYMSETGESEKFIVSLLNNVRSQDTGQCDFERIKGIEGVIMANIFDHNEIEKFKTRRRKATSERENNQKNQFDHLDSYKKSVISFDHGGEWHPIKAPKYDHMGKPLQCNGDCSLHLRGRSAGIVNQIYSSNNSVGLIIATGNVGLFQSTSSEEIGTFLSRDGGHNWFMLLNESFIYEIGDHGGLIVFAQDIKETNKILYTWDEGLTFDDIYFVNNFTIDVDNIITEPSNMEQKFIMYGRQSVSKLGMGNESKVKYDTSHLKGVLVAFDFTSLHQRVCSGQWDPTMPESDYEYWSPTNYKDQKCLFGRRQKFIRRKRDAKCFNPDDYEKVVSTEPCACTEEDWECDYGYFRRIDGGDCIPLTSSFKEEAREFDPIPKNCKGTYLKTRGYRKLPGDVCQGGFRYTHINRVDLGPIEVPCPGEQEEQPKDTQKKQITTTDEEPVSLIQKSQKEKKLNYYVNEYKEEALIILTLIALYVFREKVLNFVSLIFSSVKQPKRQAGRNYYPASEDEELSSRKGGRLMDEDV